MAIILVMRQEVSITDQRGHSHAVGGDTHWHVDTAHDVAFPEARRTRASSGSLASTATVASRRKEEIALEKCNC